MEKSKEEFRAYVMEETPVPKVTPGEAFEKGKRGDLSGYDAAGRACARAVVKFSERHPDEWEKILSIYRGLRKFQSNKFSSTKQAQKAAEAILRDNGSDRYKKYPDWTYDRLSIQRTWDTKTAKEQLSQGIILTATEILGEIKDEELEEAIDSIGPTVFMWSWAVNSAAYITQKEEQ